MRPLFVLHGALSALDEQVGKSEALLATFGFELEELVDDVRAAKKHEQPNEEPSSECDDILQSKLAETLKSLEGQFNFKLLSLPLNMSDQLQA